jgi:hypothetical protein
MVGMSETEPAHWVWTLLRPPAVIGFSLLVGILGVILTVYTYYAARSRLEIDWAGSTQIVFDHRNATPDVTMLDAHDNKITDNVYASQTTVWNAGNARFDNVDDSTIIREPLTFHLSGNGRMPRDNQGESHLDCRAAQSPIKIGMTPLEAFQPFVDLKKFLVLAPPPRGQLLVNVGHVLPCFAKIRFQVFDSFLPGFFYHSCLPTWMSEQPIPRPHPLHRSSHDIYLDRV